MSSQVWWYAARAGGLVAWMALTASLCFGLVMTVRLPPRQLRPAWLLDVHRFLGALAVIFVGVHLLALLADSYVQFSPADLLIPFASSWHPLGVAWGVVGLYLLLAVELTSLARHRLPHRLWRQVHWLSYPLLVVATIHGLTAGTDTHSRVAVAVVALVAAVAGGLVASRPERRTTRPVRATPRSS